VKLSVDDKVDMFAELTRGSPTTFALSALNKDQRWFWRPVYQPVQRQHIIQHLRGALELGSYPMMPDEPWPKVWWIAADFDGKKPMTNWQQDVQNTVQLLLDFKDEGLSTFVNLSRSGRGAHVRILFNEPVPAWIARRWLNSWLLEIGVVREDDWDSEVPSSFDLMVPRQDQLNRGKRHPGNLAGSPLHGGRAKRGGTMPLDPEKVAMGDFTPDGKHWEHVVSALERRGWGEAELLESLKDSPDEMPLKPPRKRRELPPIRMGSNGQLQLTANFCEFFNHMRTCGEQDYHQWVALASQLHRFGERGLAVFHEISSCDPRYDASSVDRKWRQTDGLFPVKCTSLIPLGYRCRHLEDKRCGGAACPSFFAEHIKMEIL